jgi:hypothetical protein
MPAGALAAFVLEKFLEIAMARRSKAPSTWLFLRIFLRARSRVHSAVTPGLGRIISTGRLNRNAWAALHVVICFCFLRCVLTTGSRLRALLETEGASLVSHKRCVPV